MTDAAYFAGFLLMALAVLIILTVGTLLAADVINIGRKPKATEPRRDVSTDQPERESATEKRPEKIAA